MTEPSAMILADGVVVRTEIMAEEVLVALGAGHNRVAAPDEPDAGPIFFRVRILHRELHLAALQSLGDPGRNFRRRFGA